MIPGQRKKKEGFSIDYRGSEKTEKNGLKWRVLLPCLALSLLAGVFPAGGETTSGPSGLKNTAAEKPAAVSPAVSENRQQASLEGEKPGEAAEQKLLPALELPDVLKNSSGQELTPVMEFTPVSDPAEGETSRSSIPRDTKELTEEEKARFTMKGTREQTQKDAEIPVPENAENYTTRKLIFVGDSRTEAMYEAVGSDDIWSCKVGAGYDWMTADGIPAIESQIDENSAVIILMGINDPSHLKDYITYINVRAHEWSAIGAETYYVSIGPVAGDPDVTNDQLATFNDSMQASLAGVTYIDIFTPMMENGFSTLDGTHYPDEVSIWIYNYILQNLNPSGGGIWG